MMTKKWNKYISGMMVLYLGLVLLTGCSLTEKQSLPKADMTVTGIHNTVIIGKTGAKDLKKLYGEPIKVESDSQKASDLFDKINNDEGSINFVLENNTNYWDTVKVDDDSDFLKTWKIDGYYEYKGDDLAGVTVYFFMSDGKVRTYLFDGEINDKTKAKKDKYLKEAIDA